MGLTLEDSWLLEWKNGTHIGEWTTTDYRPYKERMSPEQKACTACVRSFPDSEMVYDVDPYKNEVAGSVEKVFQCRSCYEKSQTRAHTAWTLRLGA